MPDDLADLPDRFRILVNLERSTPPQSLDDRLMLEAMWEIDELTPQCPPIAPYRRDGRPPRPEAPDNRTVRD